MPTKYRIFAIFLVVIFLLPFVVSMFKACSPSGSEKVKPPTSSKTTTKPPPPAVNIPLFNADSAYQYIQKQVDFGPRVPGTPEHKACADWLESTLKSFADEVIVQKASAKAANGDKLPIYNIIASFKPQKTDRILLCAHWDTRHVADEDADASRQNEPILGANDGGSGVGVLLEIARQLKANPINVGIDIILFDTEDYGESSVDDSYCLGSQYWGANLHKPNYTARYGILLDMVGANGATFMKERTSTAYAPLVVENVWKTAAELGYGSYFLNRSTLGGLTDDHLYINQLTGIPTIDIIHYTDQGFGHFWHTHKDNMKVISKSTLKAVGRTVMTVIYRENPV